MKRLGFRARLFLILSLFAVLPAVALTLVWSASVSEVLPLVSGSARWEVVAVTGQRAIAAARRAPMTSAERAAVDAHEQELRSSLEQARRFQFLAPRVMRAVALFAVLGLGVVTLVGSRVAGHLSRQLSRPLQEIVGWTERIARGEPLPEGPPRRGAPEFELLRRRMRKMARELEVGRTQALEAERLNAFRETARQVAHELKNARSGALPDYLDNLERKAILEALGKTGFNRTAAAKLLGITFRQLRYRMQRLGIRDDSRREDPRS